MSDHALSACVLFLLKDEKGRFALLKRSSYAKWGAGKYSIPGGHVEAGESFTDTVVREAFEELGVTIDKENLRFLHSFYRNTGDQEKVILVFECTQWSGIPCNNEPEKHTELMWCSDADVPSPMVPHHSNVLRLITSGISYSEQND